MRRRRVAMLTSALWSAGLVTSCEVAPPRQTPSPPPPSTPAPLSLDALAARGLPALVTVRSELQVSPAEGQRGRPRVLRGVGSGVLIARDGLILTNDHVLGSPDARAWEIRLHDGTLHQARLVRRDERYDLALLALKDPPERLATLPFSAATPRPGSSALALGHPLGLGDTVSAGIISGLGRTLEQAGSPEGLIPNGVWHFIQTDMSLNVGNSGGPLLNAQGEIIGLNTVVMRSGQGLAFAIPTPLIVHFIEEVRAHGAPRHPRIDAVGRTDARAVSHHGGGAVLLSDVRPGGPAAQAGLRAGDRIIDLNSTHTPRLEDLIYHLELSGVDAPARLSVIREGEAEPRPITLQPEARR